MEHLIFEILCKDKSAEVRENLALNKELPVDLMDTLARDKNETVRRNLASRSDLPAKVVESLFADSSTAVRMELAIHSRLTKKQSDLVLKNQENHDPVLNGLAQNRYLSEETLNFVIEKNPRAYLFALKNASISTAQIEIVLAKFLSTNPDYWDFEEVLVDTISLPPSFVQIMLEHVEPNVRRILARKNNIDPTVIQSLSQDDSPDVRKAVAERHDLSNEVALKLATDSDPAVRSQLAENSRVATEVLTKMLADPDTDVFAWVIHNPSYKFSDFGVKDFEKVIANDVAHWMASNPSLPHEYIPKLMRADTDDQVSANLAINPSLPWNKVSALLTHENRRVRYALAKNPSTPAEALVVLAKDNQSEVRSIVAENPGLPLEYLELLAADDDWQVRQVVASVCETKGLSKSTIQKIAKDKNKEVRITLANSSYLSHFEIKGAFY